ncbi:MAG TPA: GNAT family N-acetyltransferase [Tepidisphaeraceae bacterium]|jgi:ribosomal protein S18 acetylase RimI-like enzyme|nr:GNAT family N-acetyltransferase [Tepidisphaeraceae bacterium]
MSLPILNARHDPSHSDLIRLFHKTENLWAEHIATAEALDVGTAYTNAEFADVFDANNIRDVALPDDLSAEDALNQVEAHYASKKTKCAYWTFNPSAPPPRTQPLLDLLLSRGHRAYTNDIMVLQQARPQPLPDIPGLKIIPARASFRHARQLFEESATRWKTPQLADAKMLHLDDPHWDALLALKDGQPVAHIGVFAVGEIGRIDDVYVAKSHRRQGIGSLMLSRVLEISARSLFKHVLLSVLPSNTAAIDLYQKFGFQKIGQITSNFRPGINLDPA